MLRKIKVGFDSHILWNGIASVWKKTGTIQNLPKAHQTQDIECLDLINIEALTSYEVLVILVLFGKGKYTKDFWQIHITTLTNPFQNFDKSMSKSRQIQVTTLTNLALTTWIFFSSGIKNMFCCGIITHPWNTQQQLAHLHTVGSQQSSFRNISDLVTKARKCSDLSLIKKMWDTLLLFSFLFKTLN